LSLKAVGSGLAVTLLCAGAADARAAGRLFVSDERGGDVVIVDAGSGAINARVAVGKRPRGMQLAPDGRHLYVALSGSAIAGPGVDESHLPPPDRRFDGIGVIDTTTGKLLRTLPGGADPETLGVAPDGRTIYAANEDSMQLSSIDVATGKMRSSVKIGVEPEGVAVRPDGQLVYVACEGSGAVFVIDAATMSVVARIPTRPRPRAIVFARDGRLGFISDEVGAAITVFDTHSQQVVRTIELPARPDTLMRPMGLATTPDGRSLYVTTGRGGALLEIDIGTGIVRRSIAAVGQRPWGLALNAEGSKAYTANGPSGDISIVDLASGRIDRRVHVGESPWGVLYLK
jgi:YVTN family beta-propeller protein